MEHGAARWLDASESPSEPLRGRPADSGAGGGEPRCGFWPRAAVGGVGVLVLLLAALAACLPFAWREGDQTPGRSVAGETPVERLERQLRLLLDEQRLLRERSPAALGDERQLRQHPPGESEKRLAPLIEQVEETIRELRGHSGGTHSTPSTTLEGGGHKFTLHMFDDEEGDSTSASDSENADQHQDCSKCSQATEVTTTTTASPTTTTGCTTPQPTLVAGCPCTGDQEEPSEPTSGISWAYVTMAYDPPGSGEERLLAVLALARALQTLSAYPLLVLTNATEFSDGSPVRESLQLVNAVVMPLLEVELPPHYKFDFDHWRYAYWKLQIWTLTDYEKLIWLDADSILYRSVDWLFQESWMWAQRDDWFCVGEQNAMCSGIMLLFPSVDDYNGLLDYASSADMPKGDQQLIWEYFSHVRSHAVGFLSDADASFGRCLGKFTSPYSNPDGSQVGGVWSTPAFVHKSGGWKDENGKYSNVCFSHVLSKQFYKEQPSGRMINVCTYHPLGSYWRNLFCEATTRIGLNIPDAKSFCSNICWYGLEGASSSDECQESGGGALAAPTLPLE